MICFLLKYVLKGILLVHHVVGELILLFILNSAFVLVFTFKVPELVEEGAESLLLLSKIIHHVKVDLTLMSAHLILRVVVVLYLNPK